jgi:hypothetical protein
LQLDRVQKCALTLPALFHKDLPALRHQLQIGPERGEVRAGVRGILPCGIQTPPRSSDTLRHGKTPPPQAWMPGWDAGKKNGRVWRLESAAPVRQFYHPPLPVSL